MRKKGNRKEEKMSYNAETFDVIVIGAGHAGCEAAAIAAKRGVSVLLLTYNADTVAQRLTSPLLK